MRGNLVICHPHNYPPTLNLRNDKITYSRNLNLLKTSCSTELHCPYMYITHECMYLIIVLSFDTLKTNNNMVSKLLVYCFAAVKGVDHFSIAVTFKRVHRAVSMKLDLTLKLGDPFLNFIL